MRTESLKKEPVRREYFRGFVSRSMRQLEEFANRGAPEDEAVLAKLIHSIRELRNTLERIVILTSGSEVEEATNCIDTAQKKKFKTLAEMEREHIASVLASEENFERAAEILGITTVTLWRKRKLYGLNKNDSE
ncbi:MAG: hypothetical protein HQL09_02115 [Nitrospirae bacterium]|nr:hypothetical protein [Nitrospirota bacterium]